MTALLPLVRTHLGFALATFAFFFASALAHAADTPAGIFAFTVYPQGNLSAKDIQDAVANAAIGRGWTIKESTEEKVVAYLLHRKHEATVTFLLSAAKVEVFCEGYATDSRGKRLKRKQPMGWLNNLKEDITRHFSLASERNAKKQ